MDGRFNCLRQPDIFIVTRKPCPPTGNLQKRMPTLTRTPTNKTAGPLAEIKKSANL